MWYKDRSRRLNSKLGVQHLRSHWLASVPQHCVGRVGPRVSTYSWDPDEGFVSPTPEPVRNPRLTVRLEYPGAPLEPVEVTFSLSPSYGIRTVGDAHGWFRRMMRENEQFEVKTDRAGEEAMHFWSETIRRVMVE